MSLIILLSGASFFPQCQKAAPATAFIGLRKKKKRLLRKFKFIQTKITFALIEYPKS